MSPEGCRRDLGGYKEAGALETSCTPCDLLYPFLSSQVIQILLALIIAGIGAIFAFNYLNFAQRFPLVFFIGYPFWGAFTVSTVSWELLRNCGTDCLELLQVLEQGPP